MNDKQQVAALLLRLDLIQKRDASRTLENQQLTSRIRGEMRYACKVLQQVLQGKPSTSNAVLECYTVASTPVF